MQQKKIVLALISAGLACTLAACGGGGGSNSNANGGGTTNATGTVNMALTDGPSDSYSHVWVTVTQIAFHTDANAVWNAQSAGWVTFTLPAPVTIDLAALNNGIMNNAIFANLSLPAGTYKQIRFFFLSDTDTLSSSAQAISDNEASPQPLQWNDQVEYTNASGVVAEAPLEIAYPVQGIQLQGTFNVTAGAALNLATDFDLDKIIVPFRSGSMQSFTMKPDLAYFNLNNSGGISGSVDTSALCSGTTPASNCAFNLIVHAERVSADGTRYEDVRSTSVDPATGQFMLAPLAMTDSSGNPISYDIVIRGRQMQTLIVTGVPAAGTYAGMTLTGATQLSASPLPVAIETEYATQLGSPLAPLTAGHVIFEQSPGTGTLPHEIRWTNTDPLTGEFGRAGLAPWNQAFWLVNANPQVSAYSSGGLSFTATTPLEGNDSYAAIANESMYYNYGAPTTLNSSNALNFLAQAPQMESTVQPGTVSGTVAFGASLPGGYTEGQIVLARFAHVISSTPVSFVANGTQNFTFSGVGAEVPGAYYYAYVRLDNCNTNTTHCTHKYYPVAGFADLRTATSVTGMNVSL